MDIVGLKETECHFNWKLGHFHSPPTCQALVEYFMTKLGNQDPDPSSYNPRWALRLSAAYELFNLERWDDALEEGERAISELDGVEYLSSCEHILYSVLAIMKNTINQKQDIQSTVGKVIPLRLMNNQEKAGVFGNQAAILRIYGPKEVNQGVKVLREAIQLDPSQREWKISLLSSLSRIRYQRKKIKNSPFSITRESIAEELQLISDLTLLYPIGSDVLYYDAHAFADLAESEHDKELADGHRERVTSDCRRIVELGTTSPPVIAFCSKWFFSLPSPDDQEKGFQMLMSGFDRLPKNKHYIGAGYHLLRSNHLSQDKRRRLREVLNRNKFR